MSTKYMTDKLLADTDLVEAARMLGVRVPNNRKIKCLLHDDKEPSMVLYKNRYKCFVCGTGRTIDFVQKVGGMSFKDACEWLIKSFGLIREQYVLEDKPAPKRKSLTPVRQYHYISNEELEQVGIVNNSVKIPTALLPEDAYREINYKAFVGYVRRNFIKYLPEYKDCKAVIVMQPVRKEDNNAKKAECIQFVNSSDTVDTKQMPCLYVQNIYDELMRTRNTKKVFSYYAKLYKEAQENSKDMVEVYRANSVFNYHIERAGNTCVRYEQICLNPLQTLFENDKVAYEFLINSCARERQQKIVNVKETSSSLDVLFKQKEIKTALDNMYTQCKRIQTKLLKMNTPALR